MQMKQSIICPQLRKQIHSSINPNECEYLFIFSHLKKCLYDNISLKEILYDN